MRGLLSQMISQAPDIEVVGAAPDAPTAREMIKVLNPDVLTLDVQMPKMDGLEFLERLMRLRPMPVVMVSSFTQAGSDTTLKALELGAIDFIGKPRSDGGRSMENYAEELVEKIRAAKGARLRRSTAATTPVSAVKPAAASRPGLGASGKIISAFDIACVLAIGADWANSARGFMFALGCIQSQSCHTNRCPTGVATQDPQRQSALIVPDKAERVASFHRNTLHALAEMLAAAGLEHPQQLEARHLVRRMSGSEVQLFSRLHHYLKPGELLDGPVGSEFYTRMWALAQADSFAPQSEEELARVAESEVAL